MLIPQCLNGTIMVLLLMKTAPAKVTSKLLFEVAIREDIRWACMEKTKELCDYAVKEIEQYQVTTH